MYLNKTFVTEIRQMPQGKARAAKIRGYCKKKNLQYASVVQTLFPTDNVIKRRKVGKKAEKNSSVAKLNDRVIEIPIKSFTLVNNTLIITY